MTSVRRSARGLLGAPWLFTLALGCGSPDSGDVPEGANAPAGDPSTAAPPGASPGASPTGAPQDGVTPQNTTVPVGVPARVAPVVDLRADANRDGRVSWDDDTDEDGEDTWGAAHGAVFLANLDDDTERCPRTGADTALAACNDAADAVVNGATDLLDLARVLVRPIPNAAADARGQIQVSAAARGRVRIFRKAADAPEAPGSFTALDESGVLTAAELRAGVELAIEGRDVVRDAAVWNGLVDLTFTVTAGGTEVGTDTVQLRLAPLVTPSHLDAPEAVYATRVPWDREGSAAFLGDLQRAVRAAGVASFVELAGDDQWTQDVFEPAYMSMPGPGGVPRGMHVMLRSANFARRSAVGGASLREAGRVVFTQLRGRDVGGVVAFDPGHSDRMDTLNSFGNYETIPPYSFGGASYPLGRAFRGRTSAYFPDPVFTKMMESQGVQPPVYVDTSWLLVGHVDEVVAFIPANNERGWTIAAADPRGARAALEQLQREGSGNLPLFVGKAFLDERGREIAAQATVAEVLADEDVLTASNTAAVRIDRTLATLQAETGVRDDEIVKIPFLFTRSFGSAVAYQPGMVNGISLGKVFGMPRPHGPQRSARDLFESLVGQSFAQRGIDVQWIENWDVYHRMDGEVHCGSNTRRAIPRRGFWVSGR